MPRTHAGLAVALDVVYNHLGPEGNYLGEYGPYFTDHYRTPWGSALNFDRAHSDEVRHFFVQNALYWLKEFHIDALAAGCGAQHLRQQRLSVSCGTFDRRSRLCLAQLGRKIQLIAESDLNDARRSSLRSKDGGLGMDAQWSDDFHHSVHTLLTGERDGYYADFGKIGHLAATIEEWLVLRGTVFPASAAKTRECSAGSGADAICGLQSESRSGGQSRAWAIASARSSISKA